MQMVLLKTKDKWNICALIYLLHCALLYRYVLCYWMHDITNASLIISFEDKKEKKSIFSMISNPNEMSCFKHVLWYLQEENLCSYHNAEILIFFGFFVFFHVIFCSLFIFSSLSSPVIEHIQYMQLKNQKWETKQKFQIEIIIDLRENKNSTA